MGLVVAAPAGSPAASQFPRVPSLLFELEIDDALKGAGADGVDDTIVEEIARFLRPSSVAEARLVSDVDDALEDGCTDTSLLAQRLTTLGYRVCVRTALGGGDGSDCLRNLRHNFLTCTLPGLVSQQHSSAALQQQQQRRYVVDPMFRDQFVIAKPTARYAAILGTIPEAYVGPEEHLGPLVDFLCYEISAAFKQNGVVLPPWRHASSMISKWRPRRSLDEQVAPLGLLGTSHGVVAAPGGWASAVEHLRDHLPAPQGRTQQHQQQHPPQRSSMDVPRRPAPMMLVPRKVVFGGDFAAVPAA